MKLSVKDELEPRLVNARRDSRAKMKEDAQRDWWVSPDASC